MFDDQQIAVGTDALASIGHRATGSRAYRIARLAGNIDALVAVAVELAYQRSAYRPLQGNDGRGGRAAAGAGVLPEPLAVDLAWPVLLGLMRNNCPALMLAGSDSLFHATRLATL
jgi:hypothetical protein